MSVVVISSRMFVARGILPLIITIVYCIDHNLLIWFNNNNKLARFCMKVKCELLIITRLQNRKSVSIVFGSKNNNRTITFHSHTSKILSWLKTQTHGNQLESCLFNTCIESIRTNCYLYHPLSNCHRVLGSHLFDPSLSLIYQEFGDLPLKRAY